MNANSDGKLPLGLCKQVTMKLDSAIRDIYEIKQDPDVTCAQNEIFDTMIDMMSHITSSMYSIVSSECDCADFEEDSIEMDAIDIYPDDDIYGDE